MTSDLELWPTDLTINGDHLHIKDYLHTKFEAFLFEAFLSYQLHKIKETDIPIFWPTDIPTDMCKAICPSFFEGGGGHKYDINKSVPARFVFQSKK